MIKVKKENVILETLYLERGADYTSKDLVGNAFVGDRLKELPANKLTAIAVSNGFTGWEWADHEKNEKIKVVFKSVVESEKLCYFCQKPILGYGNDTHPLEGDWCCDTCNLKYVVPARLNLKNEKENKK